MIRAFGFLIAVACWGFQTTRFFSAGWWPAMPLFPFIDQWLPSPFVVWLIEPRQWAELSEVVNTALHVNAGLGVFIVASMLQLVIPTGD